jgi:cystathionine beta-lyase family protein involved in aluminum resistance
MMTVPAEVVGEIDAIQSKFPGILETRSAAIRVALIRGTREITRDLLRVSQDGAELNLDNLVTARRILLGTVAK